MTPAKRLQHMVCNSGREFSDDEVIAMSLCADAWNDMQGLRHETIQREKAFNFMRMLLRDLLPLVDPLQLSLNDALRKRIEEAVG